MNGRRIKVDRSTLAVLREMAEAYMSTQDLGGPAPGLLPAADLDQRWHKAVMEYSRAEAARSVSLKQHEVDAVFGPALDLQLLGPMIDLGASLDQPGTGGQHAKRVRRGTSRK
jgi:hypothetical protein